MSIDTSIHYKGEQIVENADGTFGTPGRSKTFAVEQVVDALSKAALLLLQTGGNEVDDEITNEIGALLNTRLLNKSEIGMAVLGFSNRLRCLPGVTFEFALSEDEDSRIRELQKRDGMAMQGMGTYKLDDAVEHDALAGMLIENSGKGIPTHVLACEQKLVDNSRAIQAFGFQKRASVACE